MTGRTHDVAAMAAVSLMAFSRPLPAIDAVTLGACAVATFAGGLAPDLDKLTADSPAPLQAGPDGKYPVPQPGITKKREY